MTKLLRSVALTAALCQGAVVAQAAGTPKPAPAGQDPLPGQAQANVYHLEPFHADFPVELSYPHQSAREYDRTRRQILAQLAANLQGNVRVEAWHLATQFFGHAPEDAVEPLIEAMDRALGDPSLQDVVKNSVEAMGRMGNPRFEAALQRAIEHRHPAVREAAIDALSVCGSPATLRNLGGLFRTMSQRSRGVWLHQVRIRLGHDAVPVLREHMMADYSTAVRDEVLKETLALPPADAASVLRGRWPEAVGEFKAIIAGMLHAAGDTVGTGWLHDALQSADIATLVTALRHSSYGELGPLRELVLRATTHARPEVRLEAAKVLSRVDGDDVADVFEVLAAPDEVWEVRAIALRELTRRGRPAVVTAMLDELRTATGTRLQDLLSKLAASGDDRAAPILLERFETAPPDEGRPFLQALAQNRSAAAVDGLLALFCGPERVVARSSSRGAYTTINYLPTLLANLRGHELRILAVWRDIPRDEYHHRAALLQTLVGIAVDRQDPQITAPVLEAVRGVLFDRTELPQMRVLALNMLVPNFLTIDDALQLKNKRYEEVPAMRVLLTDFLVDYL